MRILLLFFVLFPSFIGIAQMNFNKTSHNFGDLEAYDNRFVDIQITNKGVKQGYILSVRKPREVVYIQNHSLVEKDSTITLRFQVNPKEKGRFSYSVEVYTSDKNESTIIKLSGNLKEKSESLAGGMTSCPDFGALPAGKNANSFDLTVITVDDETREELSNSTVTMLQGGLPIWTAQTNSKGKTTQESTLGLSYFYAKHEGYYPAELGAYVNFKRNVILLELKKKPTPIIVEPPVVIEPPVIAELEQDTVALEEIPFEIEEEESSILAEATPELQELDPENYDEQYFNPINVVFVLDVSSSMNQSEKMELMKFSLFQLTDMIRPQDYMSIVTYSSDARVLLEPTSGAEKDKIKAEVGGLKASGMTAGGDGIKLGYKQALRKQLSDGENHVIIITDGAFNRNSDDYKKYIKKYKRKGINMSIVGVKNKEKDQEAMETAAKLGGGSYIPVFNLADAKNNLKQAIRILTFKR